MREVSATLRPVLAAHTSRPCTHFRAMKATRDLQRGCNGVRGRALQAKSLRSLAFSHSATLQRCNAGLARVCRRDATRCGHTYARGTRCAVAALQSSFKRGISMAWAATPFATLAATAVAAGPIALSAGIDGARSIKYPRISAGSGRRLRNGPIWGVWCACGGSPAARDGDQARDLVERSSAGRIERNQGLGGCDPVPFASFAFASHGKGERSQHVASDQRLTVCAKRRSPAALGEASRENPPPPLAGHPHPRDTARPSPPGRLAAPVGPDPEAGPQGRASLGFCRDAGGPGRAGPRGTGLQVTGRRRGHG